MKMTCHLPQVCCLKLGIEIPRSAEQRKMTIYDFGVAITFCMYALLPFVTAHVELSKWLTVTSCECFEKVRRNPGSESDFWCILLIVAPNGIMVQMGQKVTLEKHFDNGLGYHVPVKFNYGVSQSLLWCPYEPASHEPTTQEVRWYIDTITVTFVWSVKS